MCLMRKSVDLANLLKGPKIVGAISGVLLLYVPRFNILVNRLFLNFYRFLILDCFGNFLIIHERLRNEALHIADHRRDCVDHW